MSINILITAATKGELSKLRTFDIENVNLHFLITGIGIVETTWSLGDYLSKRPLPDIAVNIGIAGSYRNQFPVSSVVLPGSDCFGDMGIDNNNNFITLFEAGFSDPQKFPYSDGLLPADEKLLKLAGGIWPVVKGITVNTASGSESAIRRIRDKFDPDIETMEGAAFYYVCRRMGVPAIALRSISNMVEPRDRSAWDIPGAIDKLESASFLLLKKLGGL